MKKLFSLAWLVLLISALMLSSLACWPTGTTTTTTSEDAPTIVAFSASDTAITAGESTTLIWNATDATSIQIDQGVGSGLAAAGTISVSPASDTTYTLIVSNSAGSATQSVTVTVTEAASTTTTTTTTTPSTLPPHIAVFDITPNTIHRPPGPGPHQALMRWEVNNATSVTINGSPEASSGSKMLSPVSLGTHTYILNATNANGPVTKVQNLLVAP